MDIQTMISNDDFSTDGKSFHHNTGNNGSMCTVRVGSRSLPLYPLVAVCLGLLNAILMLSAIVIGIYCGKVSGDSSPYQITAQALIIEVKQIQIMHTEVINAQEEVRHTLETEQGNHQQLKLQLEQINALGDGIQGQIERLQMEKATLKANSSDIVQSCERCQSGWLLFNTSCYFHSASQPPKSWHDGRADCIRRGADLAVINSLQEQCVMCSLTIACIPHHKQRPDSPEAFQREWRVVEKFSKVYLFEYLPKDLSIGQWWSRPGGVWIGLTDIQTEHNWVWVNNVTLQNERYWIDGEPNNHEGKGPEGEDCAALMNRRNPKATWYDAKCQDNKEWLCEMEIN